MRAPLRFATRNLLFGADDRDAWALYRLEMESYEGLPAAEKKRLLATLASLAYAIEADFSLLRVTRAWSIEDYLRRAADSVDARHADRGAWRAYLDTHRERLAGREIVRPELYLSVRLADPRSAPLDEATRAVGRVLAHPRAALRSLRTGAGVGDPRALSEARLRELAAGEARAFERLCDFFAAERATALDVQWLIRRGFCRGLGEPELDIHYRPQALVLLDGDELAYRPLEADVLRLFESPITVGERGLRVAGERGESHQALLALGALPETVSFPGPAAELLFAPLEAVGFPVDAAFSARWVANDHAAALVRRRVIDADHILAEESRGAHGPAPDSARRPHAARALQDYLGSQARPPLLHASVSLAVGAASAQELEERVGRLRREYQPVALHRPLGEQLRLFCQHFPAQATRVPDYADYLLVEQLGAMVPVATCAVGSDAGPYIGHTLSGSRQPVLYDLAEAPRASRPPCILLAGTLGSGKTQTLELLAYQAALQGARVVDIDPKGDHRLHELPGLADRTEVIELRADQRFRGLLDPLRIAPPGTEEDLTVSFLIDVLPHPLPPAWRTELRRAVKTVAAGPGPRHCAAVIAALHAGDEAARQAAAALEVYADSGLAQLGFGSGEHAAPYPDASQITLLRIRNLPRPLPGTRREDLSEEERIGGSVLRLLAAYAMHLMGADRSRHKLLAFDEAWFLLQDAAGRRLVEHLNRWGRSENATPILVTHLISDAAEIDNLIGTRFIFGLESEAEARRALELLRLDPDDEQLRRRLLGYRKGRCLLRDLDGRVAPIQVDPGPELLHALDTTPGAAAGADQPQQ